MLDIDVLHSRFTTCDMGSTVEARHNKLFALAEVHFYWTEEDVTTKLTTSSLYESIIWL